MRIRIQKFGESIAVVIPKKLAETASIEEGVEFVVSVTDAGLLLTPVSPDVAEALEKAWRFMDE